MGDANTMTALSHLVLAGTSLYANRECHFDSWGSYTYSIHLVHGVVGVIKHLAPGDTIDKIYENTSYLSVLWAAPCMATHMYLHSTYRREIALAHIGFSVVPFILHYSDNEKEGLVDLYLACVLVSMGCLAFTQENWYGVGATVWYAVNHFMLHKEGETLFDLPALDCFTYGQALYNFLCDRALVSVLV